jgi:hypothetical protein
MKPVLRIRIRIRIQIHWIHMFLGLLDPDPDPLVRSMDPDPSIIKQFCYFCLNYFFVGVLKVNDENSRIRIQIRIHYSEAWIRGSGSGSTPKCYRSAKLQKTFDKEQKTEKQKTKKYFCFYSQGSFKCFRALLFLKIINLTLISAKWIFDRSIL